MNKGAKIVGTGVLLFLLMPKGETKTIETAQDGPILNNGGFTATEGSINESFLGMSNAPRGIRNNNPGNLVLTNEAWNGKIPNAQNTDQRFEQFYKLPYGYRAMIKLLINYIDRFGRNTITKIIQEWDLGNPSYISFLVQETGFSDNQVLQTDKATIKALAQAIDRMENRAYYLTDARFETAYNLL
jgi:hypothetical protein